MILSLEMKKLNQKLSSGFSRKLFFYTFSIDIFASELTSTLSRKVNFDQGEEYFVDTFEKNIFCKGSE